jgi:predicted DNA-binding transcriptional regulator AlpA
MPQTLGDEYLTRPQLAIELGISERTIIRLESEGKGPPRTMIGRRIVYRRLAVQKWLRTREAKPAREASASVAKPRTKGRSRAPSATGRSRRKSK